MSDEMTSILTVDDSFESYRKAHDSRSWSADHRFYEMDF